MALYNSTSKFADCELILAPAEDMMNMAARAGAELGAEWYIKTAKEKLAHGIRSGQTEYKYGNTVYYSSAPGEYPQERLPEHSGNLRNSFAYEVYDSNASTHEGIVFNTAEYAATVDAGGGPYEMEGRNFMTNIFADSAERIEAIFESIPQAVFRTSKRTGRTYKRNMSRAEVSKWRAEMREAMKEDTSRFLMEIGDIKSYWESRLRGDK